jgi:hypothetical protein
MKYPLVCYKHHRFPLNSRVPFITSIFPVSALSIEYIFETGDMFYGFNVFRHFVAELALRSGYAVNGGVKSCHWGRLQWIEVLGTHSCNQKMLNSGMTFNYMRRLESKFGSRN